METSINYKGYTIWYYTITGNTEIGYNGILIKTFRELGEMKGEEVAKRYIDEQIKNFL